VAIVYGSALLLLIGSMDAQRIAGP